VTTDGTLVRFILLTMLLSPVVGLLSEGVFWQAGHAQRPGRAGTGFLGGLTNGQSVGLKDEAGRYVLQVIPGAEQAYEIREVGDDYVVLVDRTGVRETRIPVYSIKSIATTILPGR